MSQTAAAHDLIQHSVPRRTKYFLFISNNFHYIIVVPILALILFLDTGPVVSFILGLLAIIGMSAFWTAFNLDTSIQDKQHSHNKSWNSYKSVLSFFTPFVRKLPAWQIGLAGWLLASIPIFIVCLPLVLPHPLIADVRPRLGFDLYWLSYIPILIWVSYRAQSRASEWFGVLWSFCAFTYTVCFFIFYKAIDFENILHLMILLGWFLFLSMIIHYLFRRIAIFRGQAELLQAVTERLRNDRRYTEAFDIRPIQSGPEPSLNEIAEHIGTMLQYDRIFILVFDSATDALFMKGRYGIKAPWPDRGWSVREQPSITGWVAQNKVSHLCPDTGKCTLFYNPEKAYPCKSEVTVPIIVDEECVGVIDIESDQFNAFHQSDVRLLWQIANSIGAALGYERHVSKEVDKTHNLLKQASEILIQSKNLDDALKKVATSLRKIFKADLVVLYKHAVTTWVPLPGLIIDGDVLFPEMMGNTIRKDSRVNELIHRPEISYISPTADEDPFLLGPEDGIYSEQDFRLYGNPYRFVKREKIKSMIYLKLGIGNEIVGSLFLNYRRKMNFPSRMIESLYAIANVLTMGLILKRQTERAIGPLAGTIPLAHSTAEAAFESVSRDFDDMDWKQLKHTPENQVLLKQINTYRGKLEELRRQWTNLILVEQVNLHRSSMVEPITHLESKLRSMFPGVIFEWDSREFLNIPTNELGEVIYKVIAEGVSNALVHARANRISVQCKKVEDTIHILVHNNGKTIDIQQAERINGLMTQPLTLDESEKQTGIISILLDARRWFGAEWNFSSAAANNTELVVIFPLDPNEKKEDYSYEDENQPG